MDSFGERVRQALRELSARERRQVTIKEIAQRLTAAGTALDQRTIYRWLSGETGPSLQEVQALADALGVTPGYLAFGEGQGLGRVPTQSSVPASPERAAPKRHG